MTHGITATDSVVTARGIRPWHGLGTTVDGTLSAAAALHRAHLDWRVSLQPLSIADPGLTDLSVPARAVVRTDTRTILGVVGERYRVVQNEDLVAVLDAIVESGARIDTAGSLHGGRIVWFAALAADFEAAGEAHQDYLVLSHGHDGSRAVTVRWTTVRVVCWNTLSRHDQERGGSFSVRHTEAAQERIGAIGRLIAAGAASRERFRVAADRLAGTRLGEREQVDFLLHSLGLDPSLEIASIRRKIEAAKAALQWERAHAGADPDSVWTALQGVTHYLSHETASKGSRSEGGRQRRLLSTLDGERSKTAARALRSATALVGA